MKKVYHLVQHFFTQPLPAGTLGLFRIAVAAFALAQVLILLPDWMWLFGPKGILPWAVSDALNTKNTPVLSGVASIFSRAGISAVDTVYILTIIYVLALFALLAGIYTRGAAILAWLCHMILNSTGHMMAYGVETFTHIALFYCMVLPTGAAWSLDRKRGKYKNIPAYLIALSIRLIQLHLCIMYCSSGIEKALGSQWWNGEAVWMSLQQDQFHQFDTGWLSHVPIIPKLLGWITLATEILYPFGMYWNRTKKIWLIAVIGMHLFILIFLGLYLFGTLMILLNVSAFGYHCYPELFKNVFVKKSRNSFAPTIET
jgi:hypothetical protein